MKIKKWDWDMFCYNHINFISFAIFTLILVIGSWLFCISPYGKEHERQVKERQEIMRSCEHEFIVCHEYDLFSSSYHYCIKCGFIPEW